eukprot:4102982-Amphidinium_carterae.2
MGIHVNRCYAGYDYCMLQMTSSKFGPIFKVCCPLEPLGSSEFGSCVVVMESGWSQVDPSRGRVPMMAKQPQQQVRSAWDSDGVPAVYSTNNNNYIT